MSHSFKGMDLRGGSPVHCTLHQDQHYKLKAVVELHGYTEQTFFEDFNQWLKVNQQPPFAPYNWRSCWRGHNNIPMPTLVQMAEFLEVGIETITKDYWEYPKHSLFRSTILQMITREEKDKQDERFMAFQRSTSNV